MPASGSQIGETDSIDFGEIDFVEQVPFGLYLWHVQLEPTHFRQIELALMVVKRVCVNMVSDQEGSVRELQDRPDFVKPGRFDIPADFGLACEIHEAFLVTERQRAR